MDERDRYDKGMVVRRGVLGEAHVERTVSRKNAFNEEFQDLITRYAWGEIWTRPGLPLISPTRWSRVVESWSTRLRRRQMLGRGFAHTPGLVPGAMRIRSPS